MQHFDFGQCHWHGQDEAVKLGVWLQGEDLTDHFLRILTDLAVAHCLTGETSSTTPRPGLLFFIAVDAYVRLLITLITGGFTSLFCIALYNMPAG